MKNSLSIKILLTILLACTVNLSQAKRKKKAFYAKVYTTDNKQQYRGVLASADEKGIYIVKKTGTPAQFVAANQIRVIKVRKKGAAGTGATIGLATGLAAGVALSTALHKDNDKLTNTVGVLGAAFITFAGTAIGGAIGSGYKEVILINGRSENYLQKLGVLKSFALGSN